MKTRSLIVAAFVLIVLVGTLYWSGHQKPTGEAAKASADAPPTILRLDESAITKVEWKKKDAEQITLAKGNSGVWQIAQPKPLNADQAAVTSAISNLSSLNSERLVEDKASDLKRYGLDQPAVEVDITEKDEKTQRLLVGDETPIGGAVYAMLAGSPRVFTIASYNKTNFDKSLNDLRDKRLLRVNTEAITRFELIRKDQAIEFARNKDDWQILKPKPLPADSFQVSELARKLADARMEFGGSDKNLTEAASAFAHAAPVATARVSAPSGPQELQVRKSKDTYYAKSSVVEGVYKVASDLGQALDRGLDDFRNKKVFEFGFNDPTGIEMHNGSKAYFLSRNGADWWSNGKKMDAGSVQSFLSKLRDLAAIKFVESGFANPGVEVTVTSDDPKRAEKLWIAQSGNRCIAKRENQSTLYQLPSSSIDELQRAADEVKPANTSGK